MFLLFSDLVYKFGSVCVCVCVCVYGENERQREECWVSNPAVRQ